MLNPQDILSIRNNLYKGLWICSEVHEVYRDTGNRKIRVIFELLVVTISDGNLFYKKKPIQKLEPWHINRKVGQKKISVRIESLNIFQEGDVWSIDENIEIIKKAIEVLEKIKIKIDNVKNDLHFISQKELRGVYKNNLRGDTVKDDTRDDIEPSITTFQFNYKWKIYEYQDNQSKFDYVAFHRSVFIRAYFFKFSKLINLFTNPFLSPKDTVNDPVCFNSKYKTLFLRKRVDKLRLKNKEYYTIAWCLRDKSFNAAQTSFKVSFLKNLKEKNSAFLKGDFPFDVSHNKSVELEVLGMVNNNINSPEEDGKYYARNAKSVFRVYQINKCSREAPFDNIEFEKVVKDVYNSKDDKDFNSDPDNENNITEERDKTVDELVIVEGVKESRKSVLSDEYGPSQNEPSVNKLSTIAKDEESLDDLILEKISIGFISNEKEDVIAKVGPKGEEDVIRNDEQEDKEVAKTTGGEDEPGEEDKNISYKDYKDNIKKEVLNVSFYSWCDLLKDKLFLHDDIVNDSIKTRVRLLNDSLANKGNDNQGFVIKEKGVVIVWEIEKINTNNMDRSTFFYLLESLEYGKRKGRGIILNELEGSKIIFDFDSDLIKSIFNTIIEVSHAKKMDGFTNVKGAIYEFKIVDSHFRFKRNNKHSLDSKLDKVKEIEKTVLDYTEKVVNYKIY